MVNLDKQVNNSIFSTIEELTLTVQRYIDESGIVIEQKNDSVIKALLDQILEECSDGLEANTPRAKAAS